MILHTLCCSLLFLVGLGITTAFGQQPKEEPANQGQKLRILYTGRMMGYFRMPDWQSPDLRGCPPLNTAENPKVEKEGPAAEFLRLMDTTRGQILVGTGDNFAPEIEARVFRPAPPDQKHLPSAHQRVGKELFTWDVSRKRWVTNEEANLEEANNRKEAKNPLRKIIEAGMGTVPADNVGCFLIRAGYAAVVPGKHDFYFGAERLRQLARFLATPIPDGNEGQPERYVQMLGANLVIKTTWKNAENRPSDRDKQPKFIPGLPGKRELLGDNRNPLGLSFAGLQDKGVVYPWFQGPVLRIDGIKLVDPVLSVLRDVSNEKSIKEVLEALRTLLEEHQNDLDGDSRGSLKNLTEILSTVEQSTLWLCQTRDGNPNEITIPIRADDCRKLGTTAKMGEDTLSFRLTFTPLDTPTEPITEITNHRSASLSLKVRGESAHFSTVKPGENYALCLVHKPSNGNIEETFCARFSVHVPFFYYPSVAPSPENPPGKNYRDPEPYVLLARDEKAGRPLDVAIFGVVDPQLGSSVGMLNIAWTNTNKDFKTVTSFEDPAVALEQLLVYFENKYKLDHGKDFDGIKVLLAQMTPSQAQALAARLGGFNVVVSAAAEELATGSEKTKIEWLNRRDKRSSPVKFSYLAVPSPYYSTLPTPNYQVKIGSIEIAVPTSNSSWTLTSSRLESDQKKVITGVTCKFWKRVTAKFKSDCLPQKPTLQDRELGALSEQIQLLTLCAMRKALDADIALVQKRDFFPDLPPDAKDIVPRDNDEGLQQLLDRILWKGDFLTLLYVPGSALKKAMEQSKAYDDEDASKLTISSARSRGLLPLGLKPDPATNGYFVNEVPLDPNRLYAVATTDFIGAGDTGYPDLAASAISPPSVSKDFDKLETISSVICRQLTSTPDTACLGKLSGDEYLDKLSAVPADQRPGNGNLQRLRAWSAFHQPELAPKSRGSEDQPVRSRLEEGVQRRTIWELSVDKLSLGFSGLFNSLSDEEIRQKFAGISTKSVTSNQNTKVTYDHKVRLSRSSHSREFFFEHRLNYDVEFLGSRSSDRKVNQKENLLSNEIGFIFPRPGRAFPHLDRVASLYSETQPIEYITTFKLADDKGQISFQQPRSWRLLPRMGLRWDDRESSIEGGAQFGREFGAVNGYIFGAGPKNKCNLIATQNITDCVMELSKQGAVTKDSEVTVLRNDRWLAGAYWKIRLTVPLLTRLKYVLEDDGNFFMVNFHGDKSTDTRFLDKENHQLKFEIWRGLSIGPALNVLLYENKKNRDFLGQIDFRFQVDMNFTIFNKRDTDKQIKYVRPPK